MIELLVVISVNSVLMAVAVVLLGALLRSERQGQHHCERTRALVRLAEQFRDDVAMADGAKVVEAPTGETLQLQLSGERRIEFNVDTERIRRIEHDGPSVVRREVYSLADLTVAKFVVDSNIAMVRLTFSDVARGVGDTWRIDACLAKDRRFGDRKETP